MNAGNRAAVARLAASPRTTTPSGSGASGSGYPWSDGDILYAGDLNAAIELGIASGSGSITQVGLDKRLYGTDGKRLQIRAITSFANTFALFSDGYRFDWGIRNSQNSASIASVSPPINRGGVYGRWLSYTYQDDATCKNTINQYKQYGFNTIRTWVGIGMLKTAPFTDAVTGLSFPTEIELLDNFVRFTQELGMYLWLTFGQGSVPDDQHAAFWAVIATRYRAARHVILDIQNEPGSGTVFVTPSIPTLTTPYSTIMPNLAAWRARFEGALAAIRGAGFKGPVAVQPLSNLWGIDTIQAALNNPPWSLDPNIIVAPHMYYIWGDPLPGDPPVTFVSQRNNWDAHVTNFARYYCIVHGEMGPSNAYNYLNPQPALDFTTEALGWSQKECFSGTTFFTAQPLANHYNDIWDNIDQFTQLGNLTAWGTNLMNYHTHGVNALARMVPDIKSTNGPLTDTTGSTVLFHRDVERYDVELRIAIVTNGTASGTLLVRLPSPAPTDRYQWFQGISSTGASLLVKVIGFYAEITLAADGSYPGANGVALTTSFTYYAANNAQGAGFSYAPANFNNDHWYTRGGLITGLADGKQGTIITTLHTTGFGGDGTSMRLVHTNTAKMTLFRDPSNFLHLQLRNAAGTLICEVVSLLPTSTSSPEHTIFVSWDLNTPEAWLFIKGVNETGTPLTLVNDTVDYTDSNFAVGGTVGGLDLVRGTMDFFWFNDTFHHPGNYINNGCFFDEFDAPIDVGKYGDALTGGLPRIFLRNLDVGSTFATNRGTGGNFTLN